ncbi:hypothetical protein [Corallococcus silvisoli]|uniref:hypothetical protein n=1 Tax=Corallococcus silvisoli TaxID=2697031 RepID=UPI0013776746|nr:hypothetical protein [Corallococcus silvisoli]NBD09237.1 hypothetical protein [Corallococcus silvisoli]
MRDLVFGALHLVAVLLHLTSAVLLLLARREARASTPNTGRPVLRVLSGGRSTQQEVSRG